MSPSNPTDPYLPEHIRDGMKMYLDQGYEPGGFLYSVLTNNLKNAVGNADHINLRYLTNIVCYCYNEIPSEAWGSVEKVEQWMKRFQIERTEVSNEPK